tara:strand:- start:245 stop:601 length:357 start_codon:yes stop_codon:yes gene_type:complete
MPNNNSKNTYIKLDDVYKGPTGYEDEAPIRQLLCDEVNNPSHYNTGKVECIDAIEAMLTHEEFLGYLRGNSLKYRWRFRYKDNPTSDLAKAAWYENKLYEVYTGEKENGSGQESRKNR